MLATHTTVLCYGLIITHIRHTARSNVAVPMPTLKFTHTHPSIHTHTHIYTCTHTHTLMPTQLHHHPRTPAATAMQPAEGTQSFTHTHAQPYTHPQAHTHTHTLSHSKPPYPPPPPPVATAMQSAAGDTSSCNAGDPSGTIVRKGDAGLRISHSSTCTLLCII